MNLLGKFQSWFIVIVLGSAIALANSVGFFAALLNQPAHSVYLGTVHYFEDYFFYLNHFLQGALGAWLVNNRYTNESTPDSVLYWTNLLMGKFGNLLGLPPFLTYNVSLILLTFIVILVSYTILIKIIFPKNHTAALFAFTVTWLGTSMINRVRSNEGQLIFWPFQIWKTPHFAFDRLGGAPHQIIQTLLFFTTLVCSLKAIGDSGYSKRIRWSLGACLSGIFLASINPVQAGMFIGSLWFAVLAKTVFERRLLEKPIYLQTLSITASIGLIMVLMTKLLATQPHVQTKIWEAVQQSSTTWPFLFLSLGPVMVILAFIGVISRKDKLQTFDFIGISMLGFGYLFFMFPVITRSLEIANVRVLFPVNHIFWGVFAGYGADWVAEKSRKFGLSWRFGFAAVAFIFLLSVSSTIAWELAKKTEVTKNPNDLMVYLPVSVNEAFAFLKKIKPYGDTVLANSVNHFDTLVPALTGHTTYSGHILATTNNAEKQAEAAAFFKGNLSQSEAQVWLRQKNIRYILFTSYDGDKRWFEVEYPFLSKPIFSNADSDIYSL